MADKIKITTGRGELHWVNIAGQGKLNYNEDGYDYTATLRVKIGDAADVALKKQIDDYYEENRNKKLSCRSVGYRDTQVDTGEVDDEGKKIFKADGIHRDYVFKTKTTFKDNKTGEDVTKVVGVYNSKAAKVSLGSKRVGNGSIGAISGSAAYYTDGKKEDGVSLFLNNLQIFKLEEYTDNGGFGGEEGEDGEWTGEEANDFTGTPEAEEPTEAPKAASKPRL